MPTHTLTSLLELAETDEGREQIRVMVAELRGWVQQGNWFERRGGDGTRYGIEAVPTYTTSLDAMAEARKSLNIDEEYTYGEWMRKLCGCTGPRGGLFTPNGFGIYAVSNADAIKHAIAYILTKTKGADRE